MGFWDDLLDEHDEDQIYSDLKSRHLDDLFIQYCQDIPGRQRSLHELASDEDFANNIHNRNLGAKGGLETGRIVYGQPYANWYRVQLEDMDGDMPCCRLSETSMLPFSVRDTSPIAVMSHVLVWVPEESDYGIIIGVIPEKVENSGLMYPDWISQGSNTGVKREAYYRELYELTLRDGGAIDFSGNRPLDSLANGEWGRMSDLGGGFFLDMFMAFMRMDETCGLWLFYMDKLARLSGYNLDIHSSISEVMIRNDNGEGLHYSGSSPYPWEAQGAKNFGVATHREISDQEVHYQAPRGKYEPLNDEIKPFYRLEEYRGYLGQGYMRQLLLPSPAKTGLYQYNGSDIHPAVFREQVGLSGSYELASARSVAIVKRPIIPAGVRTEPPESATGDTNAIYTFSGINGSGPDHKVKGLSAPSADHSHVQETMSAADFLAYAFEWQALHPFHYHSDDFVTPRQADYTATLGFSTQQTPLNFQQLQSKSQLDPPNRESNYVDHRYGDVDYSANSSGIFLLPEGGVVIRDGFGSEIRMVAGNIQISCPGDVWMQPGRNINMYAGDDLIARAKKSMDFTATENDVRFKAEKNLEFLAGNGGQQGRMLFENQAAAATHDAKDKFGEDISGSGFLFKAANSDLVTACRGIYLRTGSGSVAEGPIVLDASKGNREIRTISNVFDRHIQIQATDSFPIDGKKTVSNVFSALNSTMQTSCQFDGGVIITKNGLLVKGNLNVLAGHIGTEFSRRFEGKVGELRGESLKTSKETIQAIVGRMDLDRRNAENTFKESIEEVYYDGNDKVGNEEFQSAMSFSLRTEEQMRTTEFKFAETYWQQLSRAYGNPPGTWTERKVVTQGRDMMPHPGLSNWQEKTSWLTQELSAHIPTTGLDHERDNSFYQEFQYKTLGEMVPDGAYPVIE